MLATYRSIYALILREMATSFGRSPGGYVWALLNPVAGIALLTLVLSFAFLAPPLGESFTLFYATGLVPFLFYNDVSSRVAQSLNFSRPLLAYPAVSLTDTVLARFGLNVLIQTAVAIIIFIGVMFVGSSSTESDFAKLIQALLMVVSLSFGVGVLNCFLMTRFPVWQHIWGILTRPLFIISCVFFTFESVPLEFQGILWWNPLVHLIGQVRDAIYPTYTAEFVSSAYVFGLSLASSVLGIGLLRLFNRDLLEA